MSKLTQLRLKNTYAMVSMLILLVMAILSWLFGSEIVQVFLGYGDDVKAAMGYWEYVWFMLDSLLCWEFCIDSAMRYISLVFPIFACIPVMNFVEELSSYYVFGNVRFKSYNRALIKGVGVYTIIGGLSVVLPLLFFITAVNYLMYPALSDIGGLASAFPEGFYYKHPYLTFFFMIAVLYFLLAMAYSFLGCVVAIGTRRKELVIAVPLFIYVATSFLGMILNGNMLFSSLNVVTSYNSMHQTGEFFTPILVLFLVDIVGLGIVMFREKRKIIRG